MRGMRRDVRVIKMAGVSKTQTSKTQTSKRKRKDELRDLNSLRSRAKAIFVFVPRLCVLGLCLQGLRFRGLRFRVFENNKKISEMRGKVYVCPFRNPTFVSLFSPMPSRVSLSPLLSFLASRNH